MLLRLIDVTAGAVSPHFTVAETSCAGPIFKPSVIPPAGTVTVTSKSPSGVTNSVYLVLLVEVNLPFIPPLTSMSAASKPDTSSEKVNVTVRSLVELILAGTPPIVSSGATASHSAVTAASCAGTVFTPSVAASFDTVTVTSLLPSGSTTSA